MIRDVQGDDVDFYVTDELQKRLLIKNYHPIFKLGISQLSNDTESNNIDESETKKNKISVLIDPIVHAGDEQTITIEVEDFGGTKYRKLNEEYIKLERTEYGYYHKNGEIIEFLNNKNENLLNDNNNKENNVLFIDYKTQKQYIWDNSQLIEIKEIIPANENFEPFFVKYKDLTLPAYEINLEENHNVSDISDLYVEDTTYSNNILFVVYDKKIQLSIKDGNNKLLHTVQFPHLAYGSVEYKCIFTQPGLYYLDVELLPVSDEENESQRFNLNVVEQSEVIEVVNINNIGPDDEEEEIELYVPNQIGNRIINPRINQPTNLKCSLNSLILENGYIKELLNSNRSNVLFTSPTNKEYQIYKYESHNLYDDDGEIKDTWFFINADFIDEYVELHILPTYMNVMDNIILASDNDFIDYLLYPPNTKSTINVDSEKDFVPSQNNINEEEYNLNEDHSVIANVPICSEPQLFDITNLLPNESKEESKKIFKVSFDCYSSYYYCSIFYINDLKIYKQDNNVCLQYDDIIDIIPYNLLDRGEHNIEFNIEDDRVSLGIDEYIISSDILETMQPPTTLEIGFQQVKLDNSVNEILSVDDIDSYTYINNIKTKIINDLSVDITIEKITSENTSQYQQNNPYKFPLKVSRNISKLEIDVIRQGSGSYIIGVVDRTNLKKIDELTYDSYDEVSLFDYYKDDDNQHVPIQYNNDGENEAIFTNESKILDIEEIGPFKEDYKTLPSEPNNKYTLNHDDEFNIIQTLKYFNDDLYSEAYIQSRTDLSDVLALYNDDKQYYEQHWLDKETMKNYY